MTKFYSSLKQIDTWFLLCDKLTPDKALIEACTVCCTKSVRQCIGVPFTLLSVHFGSHISAFPDQNQWVLIGHEENLIVDLLQRSDSLLYSIFYTLTRASISSLHIFYPHKFQWNLLQSKKKNTKKTYTFSFPFLNL